MPRAGTALMLLLSINLFNYIDRYILAVVVPDVQRELLPAGDANADAKATVLRIARAVENRIPARCP